jgi:hypothetical protein
MPLARFFPRVAGMFMLLALWAAPRAWALDIVLNPGPLLQSNPDALAAFERAAQAWENRISTPVRVNIDADLNDDPDPNTIGSTNIFTAPVNLSYGVVRDALAARANRPGDGILAYLPTMFQISASVPAQGDFDFTTLGITRANQKAIGLIDGAATDTQSDAIIHFNKNFSFDYDSSDGVNPAQMDFQTVATHEIGHALGFLSDTDDYDFDPSLFDNATTLDLFRFAADHLPTTPQEFTLFPRELRPGIEASITDLEHAYAMSTGSARGDTRQASHWKDDFIFDPANGIIYIGEFIGIMDPTLPFGVSEPITGADLRALDLIGWDTVPEPSVGLLLLVLAGGLLRRRSALAG